MARILYDLTASGDRRFSPYCWRTKLALAHKGLDCETVATRLMQRTKPISAQTGKPNLG